MRYFDFQSQMIYFSHFFIYIVIFFFQVVRSRLQEQGHHCEKRYTGVVDCIKKVLHNEGITGFYRGCATNLLRTTPAAVITFTSFEMIHRFLITSLPPADPQTHTLWWTLNQTHSNWPIRLVRKSSSACKKAWQGLVFICSSAVIYRVKNEKGYNFFSFGSFRRALDESRGALPPYQFGHIKKEHLLVKM